MHLDKLAGAVSFHASIEDVSTVMAAASKLIRLVLLCREAREAKYAFIVIDAFSAP